MSHDHDHYVADSRPFLKTPAGWALIAFLAIGGFYLVTEHTAHFFGFLPYALLLACPLMHMFMHGGHAGHGGHHHRERDPANADDRSSRNKTEENQP